MILVLRLTCFNRVCLWLKLLFIFYFFCYQLNKFLYAKKKKEKEQKAKSKSSEVKEIRFTPNTDDHDFDFKSKHAENFLKEGNKVKAYVQFKGRAIMFKERGELLLLRFAERLAEIGQPEALPKLEGKRMLMVLTPKTSKKKPANEK